MGNKQAKYSKITDVNIEMITNLTYDTREKNYDIETIIKKIIERKPLKNYDEIINLIKNNFIYREELKIIIHNIIEDDMFNSIFTEDLIMFGLYIKNFIFIINKINDKYEMHEYNIDMINYNNNPIFIKYLIPFLPNL